MIKTKENRLPEVFSQTSTLKTFLLEEIRHNRIPKGGRLPSERWLMEEFNVNRAVVRKVMNELTDNGIVERYVGRGTFRKPERQRHERTGLVGVWFNWPEAAHWSPILQGIRDAMAYNDYHCVCEGGGLNPGDEGRGIRSLVHKGLDGFIVAPSSNPNDNHQPLKELIDKKVPLVLIERPFETYKVDIVKPYFELGAEEIVEHLIELNHRKIAFLGVKGLTGPDERLVRYQRTMQRKGLAVNTDWIQEVERLSVNLETPSFVTTPSDILVTVAGSRISKNDCWQSIDALLNLPKEMRPTAIFAINMTIARILVEVLRKRGLQVPEDISVATFSEVSSHLNSEDNWLTTYEEPSYRIGEQAAQLLLERIENPDTDTTTILLPGKLVCRQSTQSL